MRQMERRTVYTLMNPSPGSIAGILTAFVLSNALVRNHPYPWVEVAAIKKMLPSEPLLRVRFRGVKCTHTAVQAISGLWFHL